MLRKSLQHICPSTDIEAALSASNLPPTVSFTYFPYKAQNFLPYPDFGLFQSDSWLQSRPEELTLQDFVQLHNLIVKT